MRLIVLTTLLVTVFTNSYTQNQSTPTPMEAKEHQQIITVIQNIFEGTDQHEWKKIEESLAPTVLLDYTSLAGGSPATLKPTDVSSAWKGLLPGFQSTHHQIGGFSIRQTGNEAQVTFHGLAVHYLPLQNGEKFWTVVGRYDYHLCQNPRDMESRPDQIQLAETTG